MVRFATGAWLSTKVKKKNINDYIFFFFFYGFYCLGAVDVNRAREGLRTTVVPYRKTYSYRFSLNYLRCTYFTLHVVRNYIKFVIYSKSFFDSHDRLHFVYWFYLKNFASRFSENLSAIPADIGGKMNKNVVGAHVNPGIVFE